MAERKGQEKAKQVNAIARVSVLILVVFVFVSVFSLFNVAKRISEKKEQIAQLQQQIDVQKQEIVEAERLMKEENQLEYIERIAREKYGYAAPGERAYYVSNDG